MHKGITVITPFDINYKDKDKAIQKKGGDEDV